MWKVYLLMVIVVGIISYLWVRGIDYMKENHPNYKGRRRQKRYFMKITFISDIYS